MKSEAVMAEALAPTAAGSAASLAAACKRAISAGEADILVPVQAQHAVVGRGRQAYYVNTVKLVATIAKAASPFVAATLGQNSIAAVLAVGLLGTIDDFKSTVKKLDTDEVALCQAIIEDGAPARFNSIEVSSIREVFAAASGNQTDIDARLQAAAKQLVARGVLTIDRDLKSLKVVEKIVITR
jgi:hypothetical protein